MYMLHPWTALYNTWLLIKLTPKGVVFSFLVLSAASNFDLGAVPAYVAQIPVPDDLIPAVSYTAQ